MLRWTPARREALLLPHAHTPTRPYAHTPIYGKSGGDFRLCVACSNAYASSISLGSAHAIPVNVTLYGAGRGSKPDGNAFAPVGIGTASNAYGTVTLGYPGFAAIPALLTDGKSSASRRLFFIAASMPLVPASSMSLRRSASYFARSACT